MSTRVLITDSLHASGVQRLEAAGAVVSWLPEADRHQLALHAAKADALIIRTATRIDASLLDAAPSVRVIGRAGAGLDNVDMAAAAGRGVKVVHAPEANAVSAAEHTFALLLAVMRRIPWADGELKLGRWSADAPLGRELAGLRLGIVGFGRIGQRVARRARAFEMSLAINDPVIDRDAQRAVGAVVVESLDELLAEVDVVTLHTPLDESTRGLLDQRRLSLLPNNSVVINCARGGIIDEGALLNMLSAGHLAGAGLDVFNSEPPLDYRLAQHPKVVATPHWGAHTEAAKQRVAEETVANVLMALSERERS